MPSAASRRNSTALGSTASSSAINGYGLGVAASGRLHWPGSAPTARPATFTTDIPGNYIISLMVKDGRNRLEPLKAFHSVLAHRPATRRG